MNAETPITLTRTDGSTVTLRRLNTNAMISLEEITGRPFGTLVAEIGVLGFRSMRLGTVRHFLQAAIVTPTLTTDQIGDLIDEIGLGGLASALTASVAIAGTEKATPKKGKKK